MVAMARVGVLSASLLVLLGSCRVSCMEESYDDEFQSTDAIVRKFWGIQDTSTSVGKLFHYKIPADAFKGTIVEYEVRGEEESALPKWMIFDEKRCILEGVPSTDDIGDTRINVKAYDNKRNFVADMFIVEVYPLFEKDTNSQRKCKKGEEMMMIAVTIDKCLNEIPPRHRISTIQNLSRYLNIAPSTVLFLSESVDGDREAASLSDPPLPHIRRDKNTYRDVNSSAVLTWQIGCNERIWAEEFRVVKLVKMYVNDGSLSAALNLPVKRWRLLPSFSPFRIRRDTQRPNDTNPVDDEGDYPDDGGEENDSDESDNEGEQFSSSSISRTHLVLSSSTPTNDSFSLQPVPPSSSSSFFEDNDKHLVEKKRVGLSAKHSNRSKIDPTNTLSSSPIEPDGVDDSDNDDVDDDEVTESLPAGDVDGDIDSSSNVSLTHEGITPELDAVNGQSSMTTSSISSTTEIPASNATESFATATTSRRGTLRVNKKIEPKSIIAGIPYKVPIPDDIFKDDDDGNTRNLTLALIKPKTTVGEPEICSPYTTWIELDMEKQVLLVLASLDAISTLESTIVATNSANMSINDTFVVAVHYPPTAQKVNFEMSLHLRLKEGQRLTVSLQLQLLDTLAKLYGDANYNKITVRSVKCGDPFVFTWTNNTLSLDSCDNATIVRLLDVLTEEPWSIDVNKNARQLLGSLLTVEKITWHGTGLCEGVPAARPPQPPKQKWGTVLRNHIDSITAKVGELKVFRIPEDAFYDPDVSNPRDLKLILSTMDSTLVSNENWLQLDEKNREIYGLAMGRDVGTSKYQLVCHENGDDEEKRKIRQTIEVMVEPATKTPYNVLFSMTLSSSFGDFNKVPLLRRTFVEKLAALFGDRDTASVVIGGYALDSSLVVVWHNKSLPVDRCPEAEIEWLRKKLLKDNKELSERVNRVMGPEFQVTSALVTPIGVCEGGLTEFHATEVNTASQEIHAIFNGSVSHYIKEYFVEVILPVIIIVAMMLLAGIVACVLYKKQRSAKWTLGDEDERRTYRNKGIPVIFQDELEERLEPTNKSPIIMKEEKPPLPPPEYQKTMPVATTALLSDFDDSSYQQGSVSYSTRSAERNGGRNKSTPNYRKPPPYVPH